MLGVYQKILYQKKAVDSLNLGIDFLIFSEEDGGIVGGNDQKGIELIKIGKTSNSFSRHYFITKEILKKANNSYDVVILRTPGFTPFSWYNFRKKSFKLITEHHTKEVEEMLGARQIGRGLSELLTARANFSNIDGLIAVTDEIRNYEIRRGFKNPDASIAIGNGIDVNSVKMTGFKPFDGKRLKIVFVASNNAKWHGLDRILRGMQKYKGSLEVKLNIVGDISKDSLREYIEDENKIKFHGLVYGKDLDELMKEMNLAIGTLALHRKGMRSACALKVRDYTARGIPFILSYDDLDLEDDWPFCQQIQPNDQPVELEMLIDFCEGLGSYSPEELSRQMRNYALTHMDWQPKMQSYLDFAKRVYHGRESRFHDDNAGR